MLYINHGQTKTFRLKLSDAEINQYSGQYLFNIYNIQTNWTIIYTLTDISPLKNIYSEFTLTSGQTLNLFDGQSIVKIYDASATTVLIKEDRWEVNSIINNNIKTYILPDNFVNVYGINPATTFTIFITEDGYALITEDNKYLIEE